MGSSAWYVGVWLVNGAKLRGTTDWDIFHRLHNDVIDAAGDAGLCIVRLEAATVCALRRGPFKSEGHQGTLLSAARDLWKLPVPNSLLDLFYDDLCRDFGVQPEGDTDHVMWVWKTCCSSLMAANLGSAAKNSRWFSIEALSRHQKSMRTSNLLLLIFLGFQRGWWRTWDETPLLGNLGNAAAESDKKDADTDEEDAEAPCIF